MVPPVQEPAAPPAAAASSASSSVGFLALMAYQRIDIVVTQGAAGRHVGQAAAVAGHMGGAGERRQNR